MCVCVCVCARVHVCVIVRVCACKCTAAPTVLDWLVVCINSYVILCVTVCAHTCVHESKCMHEVDLMGYMEIRCQEKSVESDCYAFYTQHIQFVESRIGFILPCLTEMFC